MCSLQLIIISIPKYDVSFLPNHVVGDGIGGRGLPWMEIRPEDSAFRMIQTILLRKSLYTVEIIYKGKKQEPKFIDGNMDSNGNNKKGQK